MPIFTYKCPKCNNTFDKLVFNSTDEVNCVDCRTKMEKIFNPSTMSFKMAAGRCGTAANGYSSTGLKK